MPQFLEDLSTTESYGIILLQQICGMPGILAGSWLVETWFGRKWTIAVSFLLAGVCCFVFYIEANIISVKYIIGNYCYKFFIFIY